MSNILLLLLAAMILFAVSMALFRRRRQAGNARGSILRGGSVAARLALVAWWGSLALLAASMVLRVTQG